MITFKHLSKGLRKIGKPFLLLATMTVVLLSSVAFLDVSTKAVSIYDGNDVTTIYTLSDDADEILTQAGVSLKKNDKYTFSGFEDGNGSIKVMRAFNVSVTADSNTYKLSITGGDVASAIDKSGIELGENDIVNLPLTQALSKDMEIVVNRVDFITEAKEVSIPFATKTVYSSSLKKGATKLKNGKNGLKTVTYQYKLVDGEIVDTQIIDETITLEPVSAVKTVGTKVTATSASTSAAATAASSYIANKSKYVSTLTPSTDIALDSKGVPVSYKKKITGLASAYTWTGNKTATGKTPQPGYIAVNTKIIPLHTKLFIRSSDGKYWYGYAVAEDTGGFAKTTNRVVDLYFSTRQQCVNFGVRNVEIYVLG